MNKAKSREPQLAKRERQVMDIIYRAGQATAAEVQAAMPDPPTYSTVRALLRVLEEKGHLRHALQGLRYVFIPTVPAEKSRRSALAALVRTFFANSPEQVVATLLETSTKLTPEQFDRLAALIERAREEERK